MAGIWYAVSLTTCDPVAVTATTALCGRVWVFYSIMHIQFSLALINSSYIATGNVIYRQTKLVYNGQTEDFGAREKYYPPSFNFYLKYVIGIYARDEHYLRLLNPQ